jgi:hypothetical protein
MEERNWELAVQLRGKSFQRNLDIYRMLTRYQISLKSKITIPTPIVLPGIVPNKHPQSKRA